MIEPRGNGRRGCVVGTVAGAAVAGRLGAGVPALPVAGVLSWANTARAASRAAAVCAAPGLRCKAVVELVPDPERACRSDEDGGICMTIKFYENAPKNPLTADLRVLTAWNKVFGHGVNPVPLIFGGRRPRPGGGPRNKARGGG